MMKNNPLDDIIKCNIEISNHASSDVSFDSIMILVPGPSGSGTKTMSKTTAVYKADELKDYGFSETDVAYKACEIAFAQNPSPEKVFVCIRQKQTEVDSENYETIKTALTRANTEVDFYGFHLTSFNSADEVKSAVEWSEANEKLYAFEYTDLNNCPVDAFTYYRSFGIFAGKADGFEAESQPEQNKFLALALMAKCFGYDPGTETWAMKELAGVVPSALASDEKKSLTTNNIGAYLRYAGSNISIGGTTLSGEWIDVIRFRDWLKTEMQTSVFNVLKLNRKVPFTDAGIGLIEGAMQAVLSKGQAVGGIVQTTYDADDNEIPGYTVTVPKAGDLTEVERKSRKLTGCKYSAKLAGAIHAVEIEGYLSF